MKRILVILILVFVFQNINSQTIKRGMAYGYHSPQDMAVLSPNINWWYNWSVEPESTVANVYLGYGFEFVPMTWNGAFDETKLRNYLTLHSDVKYLLAFNEPNFIDQAKMKPSEVAAQWPRLEAIASEFNLKIVSPAVNYCGTCVEENGTIYTDPVKYLDDFFTACPTCKVDYIAVHCYMNTVSALQWYIGLFKKYGKPIWLTEFAGWEQNGNVNNLDDQINFMIGALDFLENEPSVYRYSWFIGRYKGITTYPYIDLLGTDGKLTALGQVYKNMPVHDIVKVVDIPAVIEAENYNSMNGILLQKTADNLGIINVGYIESGDWLEYKINVPQTAEYDIYFRVAATKNSGFSVLIDGVNSLNQNIITTNGWQIWTTVKNKINLSQGIHTLRLQALTDGFNLNWFQIGGEPLGIKQFKNDERSFIVFPNPSKGIFNISTTEKIQQLVIYQSDGKQLNTFPYSGQIDLSGFSSGNYVLHALDNQGKIVASKWICVN